MQHERIKLSFIGSSLQRKALSWLLVGHENLRCANNLESVYELPVSSGLYAEYLLEITVTAPGLEFAIMREAWSRQADVVVFFLTSDGLGVALDGAASLQHVYESTKEKKVIVIKNFPDGSAISSMTVSETLAFAKNKAIPTVTFDDKTGEGLSGILVAIMRAALNKSRHTCRHKPKKLQAVNNPDKEVLTVVLLSEEEGDGKRRRDDYFYSICAHFAHASILDRHQLIVDLSPTLVLRFVYSEALNQELSGVSADFYFYFCNLVHETFDLRKLSSRPLVIFSGYVTYEIYEPVVTLDMSTGEERIEKRITDEGRVHIVSLMPDVKIPRHLMKIISYAGRNQLACQTFPSEMVSEINVQGIEYSGECDLNVAREFLHSLPNQIYLHYLTKFKAWLNAANTSDSFPVFIPSQIRANVLKQLELWSVIKNHYAREDYARVIADTQMLLGNVYLGGKLGYLYIKHFYYSELYYMQADALKFQGQKLSAITAYTRVIKNATEYVAEAHYQRACLELEFNELRIAEYDLNKAISFVTLRLGENAFSPFSIKCQQALSELQGRQPPLNRDSGDGSDEESDEFLSVTNIPTATYQTNSSSDDESELIYEDLGVRPHGVIYQGLGVQPYGT